MHFNLDDVREQGDGDEMWLPLTMDGSPIFYTWNKREILCSVCATKALAAGHPEEGLKAYLFVFGPEECSECERMFGNKVNIDDLIYENEDYDEEY